MSYIEKTLLPDETVIYQARLHWFRYLQCWILAAVGATLITYDTYEVYVHLMGFALLCAAPALMAKAWLDQATSEFVLTQSRVLIKSGFIRRRSLELMLAKVESVGVDQSILGRIFGYGTIIVSGTGGTRERFRDIADPLEFRWHVQAIGSGDYEGIRQRQAEQDALHSQPPSLATENRLKLGVLGVFVMLGIAALVTFSRAGSDGQQENALENASVSTKPMNAAPTPAEEALQNQASNAEEPVSPSGSPLPGYDSADYCSTIGNSMGGSYMIEKSCLDQEALAARALADMSIPSRVASYCDNVARTMGGSYVLYKSCVEQEMHAASQM